MPAKNVLLAMSQHIDLGYYWENDTQRECEREKVRASHRWSQLDIKRTVDWHAARALDHGAVGVYTLFIILFIICKRFYERWRNAVNTNVNATILTLLVSLDMQHGTEQDVCCPNCMTQIECQNIVMNLCARWVFECFLKIRSIGIVT